MPKEITMLAHAKINLTLEILGKRPDGFHELVSVMQTLDLHDELHFTLTDGDMHLSVDRSDLNSPDNLVWKAAQLFRSIHGTTCGVSIALKKQIPAAAGLGGGSSDAAATLLALNQLWDPPLPRSSLLSLAVRLGSDVPFFFYGGTALVQGRGEFISPIKPWPRQSVVLVIPELNLPNKTRQLYGMLTPADYRDGAATQSVVDMIENEQQPDPDLLINTFQTVALRSFPAISDWYDQMLALGASRVWLAGAGPTLFTLYDDEEAARHLVKRLREAGANVILTTTV
jgi:4-diphosphocytidyl-2-C-methyl-D-erythritol kinase